MNINVNQNLKFLCLIAVAWLLARGIAPLQAGSDTQQLVLEATSQQTIKGWGAFASQRDAGKRKRKGLTALPPFLR